MRAKEWQLDNRNTSSATFSPSLRIRGILTIARAQTPLDVAYAFKTLTEFSPEVNHKSHEIESNQKILHTIFCG